MSSKMFLTIGLVGMGAFGIGCAGARPTVEAPPAAAQVRPVKTLRPVGVAHAMKAKSLRPARSEAASSQVSSDALPADTRAETPEGGVSLHGPTKTYLESFDPSGWGGPSTPRGGGPRSELEENPYDGSEESGLEDAK